MKGNGSIVKDGQQFRAFFCHHGKRISKRFGSKQEAADWLAVNRSDVALGEFVEPTDITFGQWLLECLRYTKAHARPSTINSYKIYCKKLAPLANIRLQKVNAIMVQRTLDAEPSTAQRYNLCKFLRAVFRKAYKLQLVRKNIMEQVDAPVYHAAKKDVFSRDELQRIYKALEGSRYRAFFVLAFASGCRCGEMQGLKIQSVHEDYIRIENNIRNGHDYPPKTHSSIRDVALPEHIIAMLRKEWERNGAILGGYVFTNRGGSPFSAMVIGREWHKILAAAEVPFRNLHYTRHTHATQLLSAGVPILEVQHRLGHASASTTLNKYGHILVDNKEKVLNAIDNIVGM